MLERGVGNGAVGVVWAGESFKPFSGVLRAVLLLQRLFLLDPIVGAGTSEDKADERDGLRRAAVGPAGLHGSSSLPSVFGGICTQAPGQKGSRPHELQPASTCSSRRRNAPNDMMA